MTAGQLRALLADEQLLDTDVLVKNHDGSRFMIYRDEDFRGAIDLGTGEVDWLEYYDAW